jgi:hypothetical protein
MQPELPLELMDFPFTIMGKVGYDLTDAGTHEIRELPEANTRVSYGFHS